MPADKLADIFCADCTPNALSSLKARYRDEPLAPLGTPIHTTAANWGGVKKFFVYTKQDHAVSYALQQKTTAAVGWAGTATPDTSHAPFLSSPGALVDVLVKFAE